MYKLTSKIEEIGKDEFGENEEILRKNFELDKSILIGALNAYGLKNSTFNDLITNLDKMWFFYEKEHAFCLKNKIEKEEFFALGEHLENELIGDYIVEVKPHQLNEYVIKLTPMYGKESPVFIGIGEEPTWKRWIDYE